MRRLAIGVLVVLASCGSDAAPAAPTNPGVVRSTSTFPPVGAPDDVSDGESAGSREPCTHFRNVASDYSNDLLTAAELRTKLQEVHERAEVASPAVRSAATDMLAAITAGDVDRLIVAIKSMDVACKAAGY